MRPFRRFAHAAAGAVFCAAALAGPARLPYRLQLEVVPGPERPPEAVREAFARELGQRLARAGCFAAVQRAADPAAPPDLRLRVTLARFEQREEHDESLSAPTSDRPPEMRQTLMRISGELTVEILTVPEAASVRSRRWVEQGGRSFLRSADPSQAAAADWITAASARTAKLVCKGSPADWAKAVAQARAAAH